MTAAPHSYRPVRSGRPYTLWLVWMPTHSRQFKTGSRAFDSDKNIHDELPFVNVGRKVVKYG